MEKQRIGSYEWVSRTGGNLTHRERRSLIRPLLAGQVHAVADRFKLLLGRVPAAALDFDARDLIAPDSAMARAAEEACAEQPEAVIGHS